MAPRVTDGMTASSGSKECFSVSSLVTGLNVAAPTASVRSAMTTPRSRILSSSPSVKWRPAVGAATASGSFA
jgi:hypothetical protein